MSYELEEKIILSAGKKEEENFLVEAFRPFILSCVSKFSIPYLDSDHDDKINVAMMAFVEAMRAYDEERGRFIPFASKVISRRLIDQSRHQKKYADNNLLVSGYEPFEDEEDHTAVQQQIARMAIQEHEKLSRNEILAIEIRMFKEELELWQISFDDLQKQSPRHQSVRDDYRRIVRVIIHDPELLTYTLHRRKLPSKDLSQRLGISEKKLDRGRKYILSCIIIATGDYQYLSDYIGM